ncbi:antibiotic biosynthesis monooxygenase family protein [Pseudalkalibacillus hwajinpoensis]|uniref:antibiotic biosynthesis monooxygenase family protein n=1 Tax=Guptibacillus hwajinpoensis TaxID=208199 RepID=UPI001CFE9439|nr:antibiotic biosynthesis monooxygenase [Pseudalkalibacillus hwajinpoensis]
MDTMTILFSFCQIRVKYQAILLDHLIERMDMMNCYVTYGTYDYLSKIKEEHDEEGVMLFTNSDGAALYHETNSNTFFKNAKKYEVMDKKGDVINPGYVVLNHIPVEESERAVFEDRFKNRAGKVENEPGCEGIRILRPASNDPYIVATFWNNEKSFKNWQTSEAYETAHKNRHTSKGLPKTIFSGKPYLKTYQVEKSSSV